MGCWNQTCALSQVPIFSGDPVAAVVLRRVGKAQPMMANGACYPTDLWAPVSFVLKGTYNDYGTVENIDSVSIAGQHLIAFVNEKFGTSFDTADTAFEHVDDFSRNNHDEWVYGFCMMAWPIYEAAKAVVDGGPLRWYDDAAGRFREGYLEKLDSGDREVTWGEVWTWFPKNPLNFAPVAALPRLPTLEMLLAERLENMDMESSEATLQKLRRAMSRDGNSVFTLAETNQECREAIADLYATNLAFMRSRKFWQPQAGQGSQSDDLEVHLAIAGAVIDYARKRKEWEAEVYGEDQDDTPETSLDFEEGN